jgi:hypothetical protein
VGGVIPQREFSVGQVVEIRVGGVYQQGVILPFDPENFDPDMYSVRIIDQSIIYKGRSTPPEVDVYTVVSSERIRFPSGS